MDQNENWKDIEALRETNERYGLSFSLCTILQLKKEEIQMGKVWNLQSQDRQSQWWCTHGEISLEHVRIQNPKRFIYLFMCVPCICVHAFKILIFSRPRGLKVVALILIHKRKKQWRLFGYQSFLRSACQYHAVYCVWYYDEIIENYDKRFEIGNK